MIKCFTALCLCLATVYCVKAHPADSSASISSKQSYQFVYNAKYNRVEVKEVLNDVYTSNNYAVKIPVVEGYNDQVTIDEVKCKVDNHTPDGFKPEYSYYSVDDVFYSDARICYFPMSLPKIGSKGNVTFSETVLDPRYFTSVYFSEQLPVSSREITFIVPRWMKVELKEMNFNGFDIKKNTVYNSKDDADVFTYTAQNIPANKREENSPGPSYLYPHIMVLCKSANTGGHNFTYFATLDDQYNWYKTLVKEIKNNDAIIAAKAKDLTAGHTNDMDKIKAIFYFVQDNIRYIAFENGIAGFKPESADEVLRKKYGDCKGMANLTTSLLKAQGYDAHLCWLGTDHIAYDYSTPSMAVDNHMICALNYKSKTIFLDATETYIGINEYAERIQGRQVLIENGDKYVLAHIPMASATQNYDYETSKLAVTGTALTGSITHVWKGEEKEVVLAGLNGIKKEKSEEAFIRFLSHDNSDNEIKELNISSIYNTDADLNANYKVNFKNAVSVFSKAYYVDLDTKKEFIDAAIKTDERKHDYWFDYKTNITKETELAVPANYKVAALPAPLNITNADYEFHINYESKPGKILYKKTILIKNTHMPVAKFSQWNKDIEQLAKTYNENITLKPASE
ncbi:transglutaminase-like domain-containing protein [Mucilaginibacter sp.]|uniref:transglutaminase-like domain-containing protein n=1 Tax=Mucilaginibacter sp. TaxID=1882438 RepID=UPI0025F9F8D3|nr:transglutaminase-like domain-containing protein [Mucilaginibacter sp.]